MEPFTLAMLTAQRENLRALLLVVSSIPEARRANVRAGAIAALGAIEDALELPRTYVPQPERRRERDANRLHGVIE